MQPNLTEEKFTVMISKINIVGGSSEWWIKISASLDICYDCAMFITYATAESKKVLLEYSYTTKLVGFGDVEL